MGRLRREAFEVVSRGVTCARKIERRLLQCRRQLYVSLGNAVICACVLLWTKSRPLRPHHLVRPAQHCANVPKHAFPLDNRLAIIVDNPFAMRGYNLPAARAFEFERALRLNLASPYVSEVHMLNIAPKNATMSILRAAAVTSVKLNKLHFYDLGWRSTFLDAVRYANAALPPGTSFAVANADIAFSHPSVLITTRLVDPNAVLALSRFDVEADGEMATLHEDPSWSQDAWIMRTPFPEHLDLDFPLGSLGSDNKLAHLFTNVMNMGVYNWCEDIALLHFHSSQVRSAKPRLPMPYAEVPISRLNLSAVAWRWCFREVRLLFELPRTNASFASEVLAKTATINVVSIDLESALHLTTSVNSTNADARPRLRLHYGNQGRTRGSEPQQAFKRSAAVSLSVCAADASPMQNEAAVKEMYLVLNRQQQMKRRWTYLDLPWQILTRTRSPLQDGRMLDDMMCHHGWRVGDLGHVFALLPKAAVPAVCRGSREWSKQLRLGSLSPARRFEELVVCPPLL